MKSNSDNNSNNNNENNNNNNIPAYIALQFIYLKR